MSADPEAAPRTPFGLTDADCRALAATMRRAGVRLLEVEGPGQRLRLKLEGHAGVAPTPAEAAVAAAELPTLAKAASMGRFCAAHPDGLFPACVVGAPIEAAQILGFVQVGALLLPVAAPRAGTLTRVLVTDGDLVGYGTPLFEIDHGARG